MTTEYLKYFIEVCNTGSIQTASKKLYLSAQGVGQGIQRLEKSIGIKLLERTQNGARPTEFGKVFYKQAANATRELEKLEKLVADYKVRQKTKITIGTLGKNKFLSGINTCISDYTSIHPELSLEVTVRIFTEHTELLRAMNSGEVDVGWMFHWRELPEYKYYAISDYSRLVLLASRNSPLAQKKGVNWSEMCDYRFVFPSAEDPFADAILAYSRPYGFSPKEIFYSTENNLIAKLLDNEIAVIILRENYYNAILRFCESAVILPIEPEVRIANSLFVNEKRPCKGEVNNFLLYMVNFFRDSMGLAREY